MPNMLMQRDYTLRTTTGHVIGFAKGVATFVPNEAVQFAMQAGALPEAGEAVPNPDAATDAVVAATAEADVVANDAVARKAAIIDAFKKLQLRNQRGDFTADNKPHPKAVSTICGFTVEGKERNAVWDEYNAEAS